MIESNKPIYGHEVEGNRYDCGDKLGFVEATIQMGLKHPEIKEKLKKYLKTL
jgi:UTP--glucose-1-phosphate uridylyltransferase